ncbi:hypothetical protein [Roseibium sp. RKSG952]|uniref:hypothetical protein n=1 Tax=Roseibium sp. RKSG952 TaxID=2529384 RepID=UPI0012BD438A|nr:hypothetical protein [Roseibium sp. RKSG952]MTH96000.1 hypothetical protein [Roseibium sp. RKSG952]
MDSIKRQACQSLGVDFGYWAVACACLCAALVSQGFELSPFAHVFFEPEEQGAESVLRLHELDFVYDWFVHVVAAPFLIVGILSVVMRKALLSPGHLAAASVVTAIFFAWAMDAPFAADGSRTVADRVDDVLLYGALFALVAHLVSFVCRRSMALRIRHFGMFLTLSFVFFVQVAAHGSLVLANFGMNKAAGRALDVVLDERSIEELLPLCRSSGRICFTLDSETHALVRTGSDHAVPTGVVRSIESAIMDYGILYDQNLERSTTRLRIKGISQINGSTFVSVYKAEENGALLVLADWRGVTSSGYAVHTGVLSISLLYLLIPFGWRMIERSHGGRR